MRRQTSGLENLFKQCEALLSVLRKFSLVRQLLKDESQFLRFWKLSEPFLQMSCQDPRKNSQDGIINCAGRKIN